MFKFELNINFAKLIRYGHGDHGLVDARDPGVLQSLNCGVSARYIEFREPHEQIFCKTIISLNIQLSLTLRPSLEMAIE